MAYNCRSTGCGRAGTRPVRPPDGLPEVPAKLFGAEIHPPGAHRIDGLERRPALKPGAGQQSEDSSRRSRSPAGERLAKLSGAARLCRKPLLHFRAGVGMGTDAVTEALAAAAADYQTSGRPPKGKVAAVLPEARVERRFRAYLTLSLIMKSLNFSRVTIDSHAA